MHIKQILFRLVFFIILFSICHHAFAETNTIRVNKIETYLKVNPYLQVYHTPENFTVNELEEQIKNNQLSESTDKISPGFSKDFYWLVFNMINSTGKSVNLVLELDNPHVDDTKLYQKAGKDSFLLIGYGGDRLKFNERSVINRRFVFPIYLKPGKTVKYYMVIDKRNAAVSFPLKLWLSKDFYQQEDKQNLFYGIFFGILLFIMLVSLFTGFSLKNKLFISYGMYVTIMALYLFTGLGYAFQYIYPQSDVLNNYSRVFLIVLLTIISIDFSSRYLQIKTYSLWVYKTFIFLALLLGVLLFLWIFLTGLFTIYTIVLLNIMYAVLLILFLLLVYIFIISYKYQKFNVISYALSIGFVILGSISVIFVEYGILPESVFPVSPILLGSLLEAIVLSISLIYRLKALNDSHVILSRKIESQKKELIRAFINGGEKERSYISGELHDNVGSVLSVLKNKINSQSFSIEEVNKDFEKLYNHVRQLSHKLIPQALPVVGFKQTINQFLHDFEKANNIKVTVDFYGFADIKDDISLQLYRIIQEAMLNIQKHAGARLVEIQFFGYPDNMVITIDDDGQGFDKAAINLTGSKGLNSMQSRAFAVNGEIEISSVPGKGTSIVITIPVTN
ncbi:MAG: hypothetical protein GXO79_06540 [Chlorobi bacterium]|nr:hypothetical protein [Chlorobiota bacterium]